MPSSSRSSPLTSLDAVLARLRELGAVRFIAKSLAPNDNSKNQVYLGPDFSALNLLPTGEVRPTPGKTTMKASLDWSWLTPAGALCPAPGAQLILYPQYPEVRLSGFLLGCSEAPSKVMASRDPGRMLLLGINPTGAVYACAEQADSPVGRALTALSEGEKTGVFFIVDTPGFSADPRTSIFKELARVHEKGWISSKRMRTDGTVVPYAAQNGGGYTLEAELGIRPNSRAEPDFDGWEVKQFGVPKLSSSGSREVITLMTPEPTGGDYSALGVEEFLRKYGYPDTQGRKDRLNFGGIFRAGARSERTGLTLQMTGYDLRSGRITDPMGEIRLVTDLGVVASSWPILGIMEHWKRKHAMAVYVPALRRGGGVNEFHFGHRVTAGVGTDALRVLSAIAGGKVYYDPGIKLEASTSGRPIVKRRSQFRVCYSDLAALYQQVDLVDVLTWAR